MKKLSLIFGLALGMLTVGCSQEPVVEDNAPALGNTVTLGVSLDQEDARTSLGSLVGDKYAVLWSAGDKVSVNGTSSEAVAEQYVGTASASFAVADVIAPYNVIYPANALNANGKLELATSQVYTAGSFAEGSSVLAGYAEANTVNLKHMLSVIKLTIAQGEEATAAFNSITVTSLSGRAVSGLFDVDYQGAAISPVAGAGKDFVTVTNVPIVDGKAVVYVTIPAGDYVNGLEVKVVGSDFSAMTRTAYTANGIELGAGYLVTMPELTFAGKASDEIVISTAEQLQSLRETTLASENTFKGTIKLANDIDMTGIITDGVYAILNADATFDGQGFAIKNWAASQGLIYENYGTIKNIVLDKSCQFVPDLANNSELACGYIAMANLGTVSGCVNNANITFEDANLVIEQNRFIGAIVGVIGQGLVAAATPGNPDTYADQITYKNARVENCVNNGTITITAGGYKNGWWYSGGVVGAYLPHVETSTGGVFNCVNNGNISLYMGANQKITVVGGVLGAAGKLYTSAGNNKIAYYCNVENCVNTGNLSYCCLSQGQQLYFGGVAGSSHAKVTSCKNSGNVIFTTDTESVSPTLYLAGISSISSGDVTDCHNTGTIGVDNINFGYWAAMAGISARSFNYNAVTFSDCTNDGQIYATFTTAYHKNAQTHNVGGIVAIADGGEIAVDNCHNKAKGSISFDITGDYAHALNAAGIVGKATKSTSVTKCTNSAAITYNTSVAASANSWLGGIVAYNDTSVMNVAYCSNSGAISFNNIGNGELYGGVGGVVANYYKVDGTMTECTNTGALTLAGNLKADSCIGGLVGTNCNSFVDCKSLGSITLNNTSANNALIGGVAARLNNSACTWNGVEINCAINYEGTAIFGLLQADTWISSAYATVGAITPCVVKSTTTVNGEAVTAEQIAEHSFLLGRDQNVDVLDENKFIISVGDRTTSAFKIAEGGLVLE